MAPRPFLVRDREQETADTWTLTLEPAYGEAPPVAPGQFVMVYAFGIGEVPISVSRTPNGDGSGFLGLTVRSVGAVTDAICRCEPGQGLGLRGPFGNSWPVGKARGADVLVVAGGIGLAPLRPVVHSLLAGRDNHGAVALLYGARTPADLLYGREFEEWRRRIAVETTVDAASGEWRGRVGVVSKLIAGAPIRPAETTAFVCGPEIMMRFTVDAIRERGVSLERIHLSMERHMDCGVGLCGHCQLGPTLICRDGPVYSSAQLAPLLAVRQL
jgi:anaerobic sulfite reductase subunit B